MRSFTWDPHFLTHLSQVDEEHHHLVDLINVFGQSLAAGSLEERDLDSLLKELQNYAFYHFENEEQLMDERGLYPSHIEQHRRSHQDFFRDVQSMKPRDFFEDPGRAETLHRYLVHWLAFHILGIDQSMARQLRSIDQGVSPKEAYLIEAERDEGAIQPLIDAVDGLFSIIRQRNAALEELNASLEKKVEERTAEVVKINEKLSEMAMRDQLTGLANRRKALSVLEELWQKQSGTALSCLMIDADNFKTVNDRYGHDAGDKVLRALAKVLEHSFRTDDLVSRLGGDEFLVVCPQTPLTFAKLLAEQLLEKIKTMSVPVGGGQWQASLSIGVAQYESVMDSPEELLKAADRAVYAAKDAGRNCVRLAST